jgi:hypothetical protein
MQSLVCIHWTKKNKQVYTRHITINQGSTYSHKFHLIVDNVNERLSAR